MAHEASRVPRILLACTAETEAVLRQALGTLDAQLVAVRDVLAALREVERGVDLVVCTLLFDESRMLELAARVGRDWPRLPVVCCRILSDLPAHALDAAFTAAGYVGAAATVDMPQAASLEEGARAGEALRRAVLGNLHGIGHASIS